MFTSFSANWKTIKAKIFVCIIRLDKKTVKIGKMKLLAKDFRLIFFECILNRNATLSDPFKFKFSLFIYQSSQGTLQEKFIFW